MELPCSGGALAGSLQRPTFLVPRSAKGAIVPIAIRGGQSLFRAITLFVLSKAGHPRRRVFNYDGPGPDLGAGEQMGHATGVVDAHGRLVAGMVDDHAADPVPFADPDLYLAADSLTLLRQGGARLRREAETSLHHRRWRAGEAVLLPRSAVDIAGRPAVIAIALAVIGQ